MNKQNLSALIEQSGLKPRHVFEMTGGLISANQAGQWIRGKGGKASIAILWLLCEKRLSILPSSAAIPMQLPYIQKNSMEGVIPGNEEIEAKICNRKLELSAKRFLVEANKVYFKGSKGVYSAKYIKTADYYLIFEGERHNITFNRDKIAGIFEFSAHK